MSDNATVWVCRSCGNTITVCIPITHKPICTRHIGAGRPMTQKENTRYDNRRIPD